MPRFSDHLTDIADILHSTAEGGEVRINVGEETTGEGYAIDMQVWGPDGYIARPNAPSDRGTAQALYAVDGQQNRAFAFRDNRFAAQAGTLDDGDRLIVTDGPTRFYLKRATQRVGLYTEAKSAPPAGGKAMILDLNGDEGVVLIRCGGCTFAMDGSKITISAVGPAGSASITLDPVLGVSIQGGVANIDCPFVTVGLQSDNTRPGKPGVDNAILGPVGMAGIPSPKVYLAVY